MTLSRSPGLVAFTAAAALALCIAIYNFVADVGIAGTPGAGLAVFGTFALAGAGLLLIARHLPAWAQKVFCVLIALGLLGTMLAAWFLHAWLVLALLVVAAFAFVISFFL